ncbi:LysM peptidoglycan-binding domain-containing protein [Antarcticirhabdus aurantiaca]|uniref:LysM domain-containing protein n=1 Tax=Antarcticirhabdus aurantiaca TaxID=2606717 RepID=A0ACD4NKH2_9HYPH|nr:LysM domain-containing protein [Antarcticirhabdus aurantiaca]WAJ27257.1 LysM domain-containing protein [Jeongeuplla avenae]
MTRLATLIAAMLLSGASLASAQDVAPACGDGVEVRRGDTLSAIAERCDISEARLLASNPALEGSGDLVIGQTLSTRSAARRAGERLWGDVKDAVGQTSDALEGVASGLNATAQDILEKNPDLRSRVEGLGSRLGVTEGGAARSATVEAQSVPGQAALDLMAMGLPADAAVRVNVGPPGAASEQVGQTNATADGTVRERIPLPDWLPAGKRVVVTLADVEGNVLARSSVPAAN